MLSERTRTILNTAVRDYIREGRPITSEYLYDRYDFGIKPAMIRWELQALADEGYFYQLRLSGGRFPTRKAYATYVESIENNGKLRPLLRRQKSGDPVHEQETLPKEIAESLNVMGAAYDPHRKTFRECGLANLVEELETDERGELLNVIRDIEHLEERLASRLDAWAADEEWPKVFIGETPLTETKLLSVVIGRLSSPRARNSCFVLAVGPLRMNYEKSLALFRAFEK
ncbi:MAG: hypothetical protein HYU81_02980 [Candidatus Brennerbacteria bacterium]|nr:hypothetical protein [Candidatus Brennerbacteria bacterium]